MEASRGVLGWSLNAAYREMIEYIVKQAINDPVGPEFMAPSERS